MCSCNRRSSTPRTQALRPSSSPRPNVSAQSVNTNPGQVSALGLPATKNSRLDQQERAKIQKMRQEAIMKRRMGS